MSSIQINKTGIQVQMTITDRKLTPLEDMLDCIQEVATELISGWLKLVQEQILSEWIGGRWQPLPTAQRALGCPQCGSVNVQRKCWRKRTLRVACFGAITLPRRQVCCSGCGHTWMPFEEALKLPSGSHGPKLLRQALRRVVDLSYQKTAAMDPTGPSAGKFHRLVGHVGRCRWHIPYTIRYLLYKDGIKGKDNKNRVENLREHIWDSQGIDGWLASNSDARVACTHVKASLDGLQEMEDHPQDFTVQTTSHVEREMKELNKRFENGGGWTTTGAEKLLWLHQLSRFEPKRFTKTLAKLIK